jgi:twinkle protein
MTTLNDLVLTSDSVDFNEFSQAPHDADKVCSPLVFREQTIEHLRGGGNRTGATLPWRKTHDHIRFRGGEVSLWMGMNGHGKSLLTSHVMLDFLHQDQKVMIASFEMKPKATMARMCKQASGCEFPTDRYVNGLFAHAHGRLWLYDKTGRVSPDHILSIMRYAVNKLGVKHLVIDSLMKVVKGEDDYNGQKDFVDDICAFAQDTDTHIHLIHHSRKLADENQIPGKMDSKGSGAITDQVDQCFTVWRNKKKEQMRQAGREVDESIPDAILVCDKNRHGDWEGRVGLFYHPRATSYSESPGARPMYYTYDKYMKEEGVAI